MKWTVSGKAVVMITILITLLGAFTAYAQMGGPADVNAGGLTPFGSFDSSDIDTVNLSNLEVGVWIPLISYPQRGGKLNFGFALKYFPPSFLVKGAQGHASWVMSNTIIQGEPTFAKEVNGYYQLINNQERYIHFQLYGFDGATHWMGSVGTAYRSMDASGFTYNSSSDVLTGPDGTRYTHASAGLPANPTIIDTNGNEITSSPLGSWYAWTDTLGRVVSWPPTEEIGTPTSNYSGCTGVLPISSAMIWTVPGPAGNQITFKFCYVQGFYRTNLTPTTLQQASGSLIHLQSVVLPNNTAWTFRYDDADPNNPQSFGYASLTQITLPTAGTISYSGWQQSSIGCGGTTMMPTQRTVDAHDGAGPHTWTYSLNSDGKQPAEATETAVVDPLGNETDHFFTSYGCVAYENETRYFQGSAASGTRLKTVDTLFNSTAGDPYTTGITAFNIVPVRTTTTWTSTGQVTKTEQDFDTGVAMTGDAAGYTVLYGNVVAQREYDYSNSSPPLLRQKETQYLAFANQNYLTNNLLSLASSVQVLNGSGSQQAYTTFGYDEFSLKPSSVTEQKTSGESYPGNQTSVHQWLSSGSAKSQQPCNVSVPTGGYLVTDNVFYDTGEIQQRTDPCGYPTTYEYSSTYYGGFPTTITNALNQNTTYGYDPNTGDITSITDPNSQSTIKSYDIMGRLTQVSYPDGGSITYCYTDMGGVGCSPSGPPYEIVSTTPITQTPTVVNEVSTVVLDGLGRTSETQLNSDTPKTTYSVITYDALGRKYLVYNPTQCSPPTTNCGESTWGYTTYNYDALGRVTSILEQDGSTVGTSYSAFPCTTVTDEAGNSRTSCVDGLGRMTRILEDPGSSPHLHFETDYQYDTLGNLLCAVQKGTATTQFTSCSSAPATWRPRSFQYDSMSRLTAASDPESGAVVYTYDADGNSIAKQAPSPNQAPTGNSVTTTYTYDKLNRLAGKSYTDTYTPGNPPTASVAYEYDGLALTGCTTTPPALTDSYPVGRRTSMCDGSGATSWAHDQMGRVQQERRTIGTVIGLYNTGVYNLDGSVASLAGLGYSISYTYNGAARSITATNASDPFNYVTTASYDPPGDLTGLTMGAAPITVSNSYNNRIQPVLLSAFTTAATIMSLSYDFHSSKQANNGNVYQIVNGRDSNRTQNFLYDSLNRIQQAYTNGPNWGETFGPTATNPGVAPSSPGIDAWGNLTNISGVNGKTLFSALNCPATANNQLTSCLGYDLAGNTRSYGSATYTYDAENRVISTAGMAYIYDGDGKRVEKCTGSSTTPGTCAPNATGKLYWTGWSNDPLVETDLSGNVVENYIFFNGRRIARRDTSPAAVHFYFSDHLGTHSLITDANGDMPAQAESDFYPYGGEISIISGDSNRYKFTGKERDTESGLDNFGKRYNASTMGRFMSPDAFYKDSHVADPQSWNEYAYARNNPLRYVDPTGENATVSTVCTTAGGDNDVVCTVHIAASIAVYPANGANISQDQLNAAASQIQSSIQNAWTGSFSQDGVTYIVSTQVSVQVADSQDAAMQSGAQNVIGLSNGSAAPALGLDSIVKRKSLWTAITGGPDTGVWNINSLGNDVAAHEFTHLLGVKDKSGSVLSNTNILNDPNIPHTATSRDFIWGIEEATRSVGLGLSMKSWYNGSGGPLPTPFRFSSTDNVGAPVRWWK